MEHASPFIRYDSKELFRRWQRQGDARAREELVRRHLSLARKLASRYAHTHEPFEDLVQVASLGLLKAIDRFDLDRGVNFSSFAVPTILGELKRHFRDRGWSVHVPRGLQELVLKVQEADAALSSRTGHSPAVDEIAQYLELDTAQVLEALEAMAAHHAASLDAPVELSSMDGEAVTRLDTLGSDDEHFALVEVTSSLSAAIAPLPLEDRELLALRYTNGLTQREIAQRIGVSQMQVSRMLRRVTGELRVTLGMDPGADAPIRRRGARRTAEDGPVASSRQLPPELR